MTFIFDFDHPEQWVDRFLPNIEPVALHIVSELDRLYAYDMSGLDVRAFESSPPTPLLDASLEMISEDFQYNEVRAFHATRLASSDSVRNLGLLALNRTKQVERISEAFSKERKTENQSRLDAWSGWSEDNDPHFTKNREGDCWLTPSRSLLHDGGLDCMFDRIGGEFIERISGDQYQDPDSTEPGKPYVVVATIPVAWCDNTRTSGPRRIFQEVMKSAGHPIRDSFGQYWDVQVHQDIPASRIEAVLDRHDEAVASRDGNELTCS